MFCDQGERERGEEMEVSEREKEGKKTHTS